MIGSLASRGAISSEERADCLALTSTGSAVSAAIAAILLVYLGGAPHDLIFILAYVGGTLGALIGADILNLNKIRDLGAPVASIGGAGTFDGVFLSGLIAVLLL